MIKTLSRCRLFLLVLFLGSCVNHIPMDQISPNMVIQYVEIQEKVKDFNFPFIEDEKANIHFAFLPEAAEFWSSMNLGEGYLPNVIGNEQAFYIDSSGNLLKWPLGNLGDLNRLKTYSLTKADTPGEINQFCLREGFSGMAASSELCLLQDGTVWGRGNNDFGQLGVGIERGLNQYEWRQLPNLSSVQQILLSGEWGAALDGDGKLWQWGVTGREDQPYLEMPEITESIPRVKNLVGTDTTIYLIDENNEVWLWGQDPFGIARENGIPLNYLLSYGGNRGASFTPFYDWTLIYSEDSVQDIKLDSAFLRLIFEENEMIFRKENIISSVSTVYSEDHNWFKRFFDGDYGTFLQEDEVREYMGTISTSISDTTVERSEALVHYWTNGSFQVASDINGKLFYGSFDSKIVELTPVTLSSPVRQLAGGSNSAYALFEDGKFAIIFEKRKDLIPLQKPSFKSP